jgi:uncharacterized protein
LINMTNLNCSLFAGHQRIAQGSLTTVALAAHRPPNTSAPLLVFNDQDGSVVDLDLRGDAVDVAARYHVSQPPRPRGRPKLGVTAKEITLLPDQWDWLGRQPGGASVTLRKLLLAAMRGGSAAEDKRTAQERCYRFLAAIAGDLPQFEAASRALFAGDAIRFKNSLAEWPVDIAAYANQLSTGAF